MTNNIDHCIAELTEYISVRSSDAFMRIDELDENFVNLVYATADLIRARAKLEKKERTKKEVEIPDFMK